MNKENNKMRKATYEDHRDLVIARLKLEHNISSNRTCSKAIQKIQDLTKTRKFMFTQEIKEDIKQDLKNPEIWQYDFTELTEQTIIETIDEDRNIIDNIEFNINGYTPIKIKKQGEKKIHAKRNSQTSKPIQ